MRCRGHDVVGWIERRVGAPTPAVIAVTMWLSWLMASGARAQPPESFIPVDQAVADLDRLSLSLRRVEPGLRSSGEQSTLYSLGPLRPGGDVMPVYYRLGPGFAARVNRLDYVVRMGDKELGLNIAPRHDGEFVELIPPNAVFELQPMSLGRDAIAAPVVPPAPDFTTSSPGPPCDAKAKVSSGPLDLRLDGRVSTKVDARIVPASKAATAAPSR